MDEVGHEVHLVWHRIEYSEILMKSYSAVGRVMMIMMIMIKLFSYNFAMPQFKLNIKSCYDGAFFYRLLVLKP